MVLPRELGPADPAARRLRGSWSLRGGAATPAPGPSSELVAALAGSRPGKALDLAAGSGRHARWLADRGWDVTAVDISIEQLPGIECVRADLEKHEYRV